MTQTEMLAVLQQDPKRGIALVIRSYAALAEKTVRSTGGAALSKEDAEEIVSDVFLQIYESRDRFDPAKGSLASFVITLARRRTVDLIRKRKGADAGLPLTESLPTDADVETEVLRRETSRRLALALIALGEPDATIVSRRYYLGESYAAIGKRVGLSENAVNKRCLRALEKLRSVLEKGE